MPQYQHCQSKKKVPILSKTNRILEDGHACTSGGDRERSTAIDNTALQNHAWTNTSACAVAIMQSHCPNRDMLHVASLEAHRIARITRRDEDRRTMILQSIYSCTGLGKLFGDEQDRPATDE